MYIHLIYLNQILLIQSYHVNYLLISLDEIELFNFQQKSSGILYTTITYDRVSYFEGEFCSAAQKQALRRGQKVAMFKGKCPTKNLFSMIDPACDGQQFKFIESIYKDGEEIYEHR